MVAHPYNGILVNKKTWTVTHNSLDRAQGIMWSEKPVSKGHIYCVIYVTLINDEIVEMENRLVVTKC